MESSSRSQPFDPHQIRIRTWRRVQHIIHPPRRRPLDPEISEHRLELPRLPPQMAGMRVVHLSDIHYGLFLSRTSLARLIDLTMALEPDLIAMTGDFVTQSPAFIEPVGEMLGRLQAPLGIYAVLGNHDFRAGAEAVTSTLTRRNIQVLRNTHLHLNTPAGVLKIAGIDDSRQNPDLEAALAPHDPDHFTLLLAHNPVALEAASEAGVDLVLSGHTHGGQIKFGFAENWYQRHAPEGFLRQGRTRMYVSRGIGKVILPMRVGCPPELVAFDLYPEE